MPRTDFRARAVKSTIAISIALALAIAALRSAEAATENVYRYSTPQTGYLMLGPADFVPVKSGLQYQTNGNTGIYTTADGDVCFHAPLQLAAAGSI